MAANYVLIEKISVGAAGASSVTFSGIPQTGYTDLVVKMTTRGTYAGIRVQFNGDTGANYTWRALKGDGSNAESENNATYGSPYNTFIYFRMSDREGVDTANTFGNGEFYVPNYTSSNQKSVSLDGVAENNAVLSQMSLTAGLWSGTAAITSMTLTMDGGGTLNQHSTFYLYGVAKLGTTPAIVPYATGGDTIMTDGTYWYHAFKSSGTFTPAKGLSCDVLVVAGGGGGAGTNGAGGGAGGIFYATAQSLATSGYTVTIGAGGNGGANSFSGSNGSDSQFGSLTLAKGGGYGGITTGGNGGSGGGAYANGIAGITNNGGTSTQTSTGGTGYGNSGGNAIGLVQPPDGGGGGAGGGGAGSAGSSTSSGGNGNGGAGLNTWSAWATATGTGVSGYYAGGGGGSVDNRVSTSPGSGGSGGGGAGFYTSNGGAGTANTGGGGGGAGYNGSSFSGGNGGSGLVIVRYAV